MSRVRLDFWRPEEQRESPLGSRLLGGANWAKVDETPTADPLHAFDSEHSEHGESQEPAAVGENRPEPWVPAPLPPEILRPPSRLLPRVLALGLVGVAIATGAAVTYYRADADSPNALSSATPTTLEGRAVISSNPVGALVFVNDTPRGATPIDLLLPVGVHTLQLQHGTAIRTLPLEIVSNQVSSQYIELPTTTGLSVTGAAPPVTPPAGRVEAPRPAPPPSRPAARLPEASPRPAALVAQKIPLGSSPQAVVVPEGWISIDLPFPVQVTENGRVLGTIAGTPLKLPVGLHTIELANATYEFRTTLAVNITVGKTTAMPVTVPNGTLSVNALPWAEVFVDGRNIGTTPLANIPVPVGSHEILWRHPTLGDRRQTVAVTARTPVRRGTDYTR